MDYTAFFDTALEQVHAEQRYRTLCVQTRGGAFPYVDTARGRLTTWCGVDYLGFSQHPILKNAMKQAIDYYGVGAGGTRSIGGTHCMHTQLETKLASWHHKESALLFSTGYVANEATLGTLGQVIPNLVFISDAQNHMSIIAGIRAAQTTKRIFKHNDLADLELILQSLPLHQPKVIVFESIYSMSGDIAPTPEIVTLAKRYNALTYLDEVHATGVYGQTGAGISELQGTAREIDFIQGTLGKSLGLFGGYITGSKTAIETLRLNAHGFIFTVSLPPALCAAALAAIEYRQHHDAEAKQLLALVDYLKTSLTQARLPLLASASQILPLSIADSGRCQAIAKQLLEEFHIYIQAVNYPTVRKGEERLRISPTALHTEEMADALIKALVTTFNT